jgi:hypothetical protein
LRRTNPARRSPRRAHPPAARAARVLAAAALLAGAGGCGGALARADDDTVAPPTSLTAGTGTIAPGGTTATGTTVPPETTTTGEPPATDPPETTPEPEPAEAPAQPAPRETQAPPPPTDAPRPAPSFADQARGLLPAGIDRRLPGWTVQWQGSRTGYLAATYPASHSIVVYVRPGRSAALTAYDLAHEYGHALDVTYLNDGLRGQWGRRRGYDASRWFGCDMCDDFATPSGDWAESVAVCLTGNRGTFRSRLAGVPGPADCAWIASVVGGW